MVLTLSYIQIAFIVLNSCQIRYHKDIFCKINKNSSVIQEPAIGDLVLFSHIFEFLSSCNIPIEKSVPKNAGHYGGSFLIDAQRLDDMRADSLWRFLGAFCPDQDLLRCDAPNEDA